MNTTDVASNILHFLIESDALTDQEQPNVSFNDIREAFESSFGSFADEEMNAAIRLHNLGDLPPGVLPVCSEWLRGFQACIAFHSHHCDEWLDMDEQITIVCRNCGDELHMTPREHLDGQGCERCYPNTYHEQN